MEREERIRNAIRPFLPAGTEVRLAAQIVSSRCHLTITRDRRTKAGDYRHPFGKLGHRISVNGSLNQYAFLVTFVHEMAHLINWERHGRKVDPHGKEWKKAFQEEMAHFLRDDVFPPDLLAQLRKHMAHPKAATVRDLDLVRLLRNYDRPSDRLHLEDVPTDHGFILGKRRFKKGEQLRKRFRCTQVDTGKLYLISAIAEVELA